MENLVYIVEDESDIAELIKYSLSVKGYPTRIFNSGEEAIKAIEKQKPTLLLLDLMLPGLNGLGVCQRLKSQPQTQTIPIIMISAKGEESDIAFGLELGADDYVTKPFSPKILQARVSAVLRRTQKPATQNNSDVYKIGDLSLDLGKHEVKVAGSKIELTKSEFQILHKLATKPGWVFTRTQIVEAIHGDNFAVTDRAVDFQMVGLRKKLGTIGSHLETVRGVGYKFKEL